MPACDTLEAYEALLRENRLTLERHIPFFGRWVRSYLGTTVEPGLGDTDRLRHYLDSLQRQPRVADWQLPQAENAVILYQQYKA